jgi:hypothetical protein
MARPAIDNVRVEWLGSGTGTMTLGAAVSGFQAFPASLNGHIVSYSIEHQGGVSPAIVERESGFGTYTSAGTTLTRTFVTFSTAGAPTKVSFSAGTKHVRIVPLSHEIVANQSTSDPTVNDDILAGYLAWRSCWANTATGNFLLCVDHAAGAARWATLNFARLDPGTTFTGNETVTATMHGTRREFNGTTATRVTVPDGLPAGFEVKYTSRSTTASLGALTIERASADGNQRLGTPGVRILRPGGLAIVSKDGDVPPRIDGDLGPATMAAQNGGASFLLERGVKQIVSGGVLQTWGDRYGLHDFNLASGSPGVGEAGQMTGVQPLDNDSALTEDLTYAGTSLLFGFSFRIDAVAGTNIIPIHLADFAAGRGFYLATVSSTELHFIVMRNASVFSTLQMNYALGRPLAGGVAINRTAGYAYAFFDESHADREREETATGLTFVVDWTAAVTIGCWFGPFLDATQSFTWECYAGTVRDNLSNFANVNDARDQAHSMLRFMRDRIP